MYLLIKYIKSVLWRAAKRLPCIEDARCLKVNKYISYHIEEVIIIATDVQLDKNLFYMYYSSSWTARPLQMKPIGCSETSVNYQPMLRNIPNEQKAHSHRSESLKPCRSLTRSFGSRRENMTTSYCTRYWEKITFKFQL